MCWALPFIGVCGSIYLASMVALLAWSSVSTLGRVDSTETTLRNVVVHYSFVANGKVYRTKENISLDRSVGETVNVRYSGWVPSVSTIDTWRLHRRLFIVVICTGFTGMASFLVHRTFKSRNL